MNWQKKISAKPKTSLQQARSNPHPIHRVVAIVQDLQKFLRQNAPAKDDQDPALAGEKFPMNGNWIFLASSWHWLDF